MEIDADDELFIRRTITKEGRSRAYLNNTPVPVQTLRDIGEYLVDIHGQHAHQSLSRPQTQREILDQARDATWRIFPRSSRCKPEPTT